MGKITALVAQKRSRLRINVHLDGRFAFSLAAIEAARLRVGQELGREDLERLKVRDALATAHERALGYLSVRPRSQAEMRKYLAEKDVAPEHVEEVLARLTRAGLLDDQAFAQYWRDNREAHRPRGAQALRQELRQKGVAREVIDQALAGLDEEQAALRLARARAPRLAGLDRLTFKRRLAGYLGRRGYGYDVSGPVIEQVWREVAAGEPGAHDQLDDDHNEEN
jgi:regulatory protein